MRILAAMQEVATHQRMCALISCMQCMLLKEMIFQVPVAMLDGQDLGTKIRFQMVIEPGMWP